eukprot:Opistho-2@94470
MKQIFSKRSLLQNKSTQIGLGLLTCLALSSPSFAQDSKTSSTKPTIVSTITDNGITTTTYSNGQVVKTVADGYYLDSAFYKNSNVLKTTAAKKYWKITDRVGVAIPVGNTVNGKDITMFLRPGVYNSLSVTRQWGIIGIGVTGGYQNFQVGDDYSGPDGRIFQNFKTLVDGGKVPAGATILYDKVSSLEDFYLMIGPSLDIPISKKFFASLDARGGLMNTSAPRFGAYLKDGNLGAQSLIFRMNSSASKNKLGAIIAIDLMYKLSPKWSLGANLQGFITETPFTTVGQDVTPGSTMTLTKEDVSTHGGYNLGLALSHTFGEDNGKTVYTLLPPPPAPIVAYAPTLLGENGKMYDYKSSEKPVFKWKSNSPNPDQEEYLFKLYKADGSDTPIYQQTTKNTSLTLPDNVALVNGDECNFYYYSVQSVVQNKVFSEADAASFGYKAKPVAVIAPTKPTTDQPMYSALI